jgi:subtilisin family serine protease
MVAAIAAGKTYGVAKNANIISVKVLGNTGTGTTADSIEGLNYVMANIKRTNGPPLACMSLSSEPRESLDDAATDLISLGVTLVASAGNDSTETANFPPGRLQGVITVGSSNITNHMAPTVTLSTYSRQVLTSPRPGILGQAIPLRLLEHRSLPRISPDSRRIFSARIQP